MMPRPALVEWSRSALGIGLCALAPAWGIVGRMGRTSGGDDGLDAPLRRLGGGRWQTRDARFTIEPQSGTWVVVDAETTDELGLPLVRGPFGSLAAARVAIAEARTAAPPASPLRRLPPPAADPRRPAAGPPPSDDEAAPVAQPEAPAAPDPAPASRAPDPPPADPRWLRELGPDERRRARRAIDRLTDAGAPDPAGMVRRDVVGDVPAIAAFAIQRAFRDLEDPGLADIVGLLTDGRDRALDVRWHLVDGSGRRIRLDPDDLEEVPG